MRQKVLVVDDQRGIRSLLEIILKQEGFNVASCQKGSEVIQSVQTEQPDLIIMDYRLPEMNGIKVTKELEQLGYRIPIILMSGLVDEVKEKSAPYITVKDYFNKPFDINDAKAKIKKALQTSPLL
ncbi:two-component system, response regulator, stage 0 sporulation protein F/two-component system, NtrC family, response regulator AtoC [Pelagirhabdus alkalitolerans]|uniref:Two-component system, response regulator, stage 0 sporulation protein F/two-component system, NtrC family, response regulator AtoC n=1 Tax=Pelagirhabdus alkalitolerans TaxID=1612202 RepID=A0A1G6GHT6_9BACI|nr:response regulator [Pelagirhabdus alkalitolerans]SDB81568.1 two-component system, response regulator, stage 0 sporulation protein F/two-component system, NtrC family, response regulator AtoC [Pelagirhabdus alkalitolerans]